MVLLVSWRNIHVEGKIEEVLVGATRVKVQESCRAEMPLKVPPRVLQGITCACRIHAMRS
jgi:hypothetical protein